MTTSPLTPAEIRLAQYADRSTWSTATYDSGNEKALHEIALGLKAELDRVRQQRKFLLDQIAKKGAASGAGDLALAEFLAAGPVEETHVVADDSDDPEHVDDCPGRQPAAPSV
jgi:hypothetical protein